MKRVIKKLIIPFAIIFIISFATAVIDNNQQNPNNKGTIVSSIYSQTNNQANYNNIQTINENYQNAEQLITFQTNNGYIVELKEQPLVKKQLEIEKSLMKSTKKSLAQKKSALKSALQTHNSKLKTEHAKALSDINSKITGKVVSNNFVGDIILKITRKAISNTNVKVMQEYTKTFNGFALNISTNEIEKLKKSKYVKRVYPNVQVNALLMDSVPLINADDVWKLDSEGNNCATSGKDCLTGKGVTIAIIDTGVDYTHPDLGGCLGINCKVVGGYDFVNSDNDPMDDQGHGTHVASTAVGKNYGNGLNGVAPDAKIYAYKVLSNSGRGYESWIISGIEKAVDPNSDGDFSDHVNIISMSLGGSGNPDDPMSRAIDNAVDAGVVAVIAAGNSGPNEQTIASPGTARKAITIGASNKTNSIASFSSRGPVIWTDEITGQEKAIIKPDIVTPGVDICAVQYDSAWNDKKCYDDKHISISGTSMATPHVAGAVALIKQVHPDWTPEEIKSALKVTAIDIRESITTQGNGRIDVLEANNLNEKPLIAEITTNGEVTGRTTLDILGTAKGQGFQKYTLFFRRTDLSWIEICSSNEPKENMVLCNWDITNLPDKKYYLKLEAVSSKTFSEYGLIEIKNTEITSPISLTEYIKINSNKVIWRSDEPIEIYGTASGNNFNGYSLKWCKGSICSQKGLSYLGDNRVENGLLGVWNIPTSIGSGFYKITLENNHNGQRSFVENEIYIETDLLKGWPRWRNIVGGEGVFLSFKNQPTIADINKDGNNDLITAYETNVNVLDKDGNSLPGWPKEITTRRNEQYMANMQFGPAVGDINNDGNNEIVIGDNAGYIHIFNKEGNYIIPPKKFNSAYVGTITLSNINDDKNLEIIWGDWSSNLFVVNDKGKLIWKRDLEPSQEYPYSNTLKNPVSIADLNNDGKKELIVETRSYNNIRELSPSNSHSMVWVFDKDGNSLPGWPRDFKYVSSNFVIVDINKDGNKEIVFATLGGKVYVLDYNGNSLPGWPISIYSPSDGNEELEENRIFVDGVSVGDINLDGNIEIVFTAETFVEPDIHNTRGCLYVYSSEGSPLNGFPICGDDANLKNNFWGVPIIANIDKDLEMEIIPASNGGWNDNNLGVFYVINHDGSIVEGFPKYLDDSLFGNVFPVGDLDGDKDNELIIGTWKGTTFVYDLPGKSDNDDWPMFQHDPQHTGCYDCDKQPTIGCNYSQLPARFIPTTGYYFEFSGGRINLWNASGGLLICNGSKWFDRTGTQTSIGLPATFKPVVGYYSEFSIGKINLWNASGKIYEYNNISLRWTDKTGTQTQLGLPSTFKPVVGYYHLFDNGRINLWNASGNLYIYGSGYGWIDRTGTQTRLGLPSTFKPVAGYYYNFTDNGAKIDLFDVKGYLYVYNGSKWIDKTSAIAGMGLPTGRAPVTGYFDEFKKAIILWYSESEAYSSGNGISFERIRLN